MKRDIDHTCFVLPCQSSRGGRKTVDEIALRVTIGPDGAAWRIVVDSVDISFFFRVSVMNRVHRPSIQQEQMGRGR